jgi:pyruvate/2-oxoglutarate/acetoin dehydrogenase E1 component
VKYGDHLTLDMGWLARQTKTVFLGEGITNAGRIYGTMDRVTLKNCIEMPIAENLIVGSAIGLAIAGYRPIVIFQRMDFMLVSADAIINHLALLPEVSGGQFELPVIIRTIIGNRGIKFNAGLQHCHNFTRVFEPYIRTIPYQPGIYQKVLAQTKPVIIVEERDEYETDYPARTL